MTTGFNQEKVLEELSRNNKKALEQLFTFYYPRLYGFSKSFLKLEEGIDDILQEVFLKIWENRKNIKTPDTFNSYIFTITRNRLLNELRSRLNDKKLKDKIKNLSVAEELISFELADYTELKEKMDLLVGELPERQREVFRLSRVEGLSYKEIGEKLNISEKTIEYHIHQSISFLKKRLKSLGLISLLYFYLFF
jgi:RNA polymerase sigma-70 factor, ECF subfamily